MMLQADGPDQVRPIVCPGGSGVYVCQECGYQSPKWLGRCPDCGRWNAFLEEPVERRVPRRGHTDGVLGESPRPITEVAEGNRSHRTSTGFRELDRILGGGLVASSVVLIGGEPGIGKSTLLLQSAGRIASSGLRVLYATGEESSAQVRMRAERLKVLVPNLWVMGEQDLEAVCRAAEEIGARLLVVDSVHAVRVSELASAPGSVSQVRECTGRLQRFAKAQGITVVLVGHVSKAGAIAGPKVMEHLVDVVLFFEGDRQYRYRVLRADKNRFGSTEEIAVFEMTEAGLREVGDVSEALIAGRPAGLAGAAVAACLEGRRPVMVEVQALVAPSPLPSPRRVAMGFDTSRMAMVLAVLEKRVGVSLLHQDVYLKVSGGFRISDPAADLAVAAAVASSCYDCPIPAGMVFAGEVGLGGEVRPVRDVRSRLREAERLGFSEMVVGLHTEDLSRRAPVVLLRSVETVWGALEVAVGSAWRGAQAGPKTPAGDRHAGPGGSRNFGAPRVG